MGFVDFEKMGAGRVSAEDRQDVVLAHQEQLVVTDLEGLADVAHAHHIPLIIDSTVATPYLCRPIEWGADVVTHSATKFLSGHGTVIGGVVVDGGNFDWEKSARFPELTTPYEGFHNMVFSEER